MITEVLVAASALTLPQMIEAVDHYPKMALRANRSAAALVEFVVDEDGAVTGCRNLETMGNDRLASQICALHRGKTFEPARDIEGQPVRGVVRMFIRYAIMQSEEGQEIFRHELLNYTHSIVGFRSRARDPHMTFAQFKDIVGEPSYLVYADAVVGLEELPGTDREAVYRHLAVMVDADGTVTHCNDDPEHEEDAYQAFTSAACNEITSLSLPPLVVEGKAVPHVRPFEVKFVSNDAASDAN